MPMAPSSSLWFAGAGYNIDDARLEPMAIVLLPLSIPVCPSERKKISSVS